MRRLIWLALALGTALASLLALAPAASAGTIGKHGYVRDSGCYGSRIDTHDLVNSQGKLGRVELWYSTRNGGENCVITRSSVGRVEMIARLDVDMDGSRSWTSGDVYSADHGVYNSYAGGAYRSPSNGRCVRFFGLIDRGGSNFDDYTSSWGHCS